MENQFDAYKKELGNDRYNPITDREYERQLLLAFHENPKDTVALSKLIYANMRFVLYVLKEFNIPNPSMIMDIIQEGNIGLIQGIKRFDPIAHPDIKLFSYAVWWIRWSIRKVLEDNKQKMNLFVPLTPPEHNSDDYDGKEYYYNVHDEKSGVAEEVALKDIMDFMNKVLNKREVAVIRLYFGIGHKEPKTLEAIGQQLYMKFARVQQIRDQALKKLRQSTESALFGDYFSV